MSEAKLRLLDKFAQFLAGNVVSEDGESLSAGKCVSGSLLNQFVRSFSSYRHDEWHEALQANSSEYVELFKNVSLAEFAASSCSAWSNSPDQMAAFNDAVPIIVDREAAKAGAHILILRS